MQKVETAHSEADPWAIHAVNEGIPTMATAIAEIQQGLGGELPGEPLLDAYTVREYGLKVQRR